MRQYSELILLPTFQERLDYLQLFGHVGIETFGFDRYLNQTFYRSAAWKQIRDRVIIRDSGCDLGIVDLPIYGKLIVHHMNPISESDILEHGSDILDPEFLICTSVDTHNMIHYGLRPNSDFLMERKPNDTCPWKQ